MAVQPGFSLGEGKTDPPNQFATGHQPCKSAGMSGQNLRACQCRAEHTPMPGRGLGMVARRLLGAGVVVVHPLFRVLLALIKEENEDDSTNSKWVTIKTWYQNGRPRTM